MANFRYSHLYTSGNTAPSATQLNDAEIAVMITKGSEGLFFKNSANEVVKVGIGVSYTKDESDAKYETKEDASNKYVADAKYETSGETKVINFYAASGDTPLATIDATPFIKDGMIDTVEIKDGKLVITWNTDGGKEATKIELTDIFNPANYYTKDEIDAYSGRVNTSLTTLTTGLSTVNNALSTHTADTNVHIQSGERNKWNDVENKADKSYVDTVSGNVETVSGNLNTHINDSEKHVTADDKTKWNEVTGKTNNTDFTAHTANTEAHVTKEKQKAWDDHVADTTIHVTTGDKTKWDTVDNKIDATAVTETYVAKAEYNSTNKKIYFYNGNSELLTASTIDATDFIKDGLVEDVTVTAGTGDNSGKQVLKITFVGVKEAIELTLEEIFKPENYYTKTDIDAKVTAINGDISTVSGVVDTNTTNIEAISGDVKTISGDVATLKNNVVTGGTTAFGDTDKELKLSLKKENAADVEILMNVIEDATGILLKKGTTGPIILSGGTF